MVERVLSGVRIATMTGGGYGLIEHGVIAIRDGVIAHVGQGIPEDFAGVTPEDMGGRLVTPALIDCHTHLVFGGNRALEFEMRLNGASYEEVARAGGGIVSTVRDRSSSTRSSASSHVESVWVCDVTMESYRWS